MKTFCRIVLCLSISIGSALTASAAEPLAKPAASSGFSVSARSIYVPAGYLSHLPGADTRLTKLDYSLYAGVVAYRTLDYFSTAKCAKDILCHERELPRAVIETQGGLAAFEAGMAGLEIGTSVWLHHHGHRKLARTMDFVSVGGGGITVALNSIYGEKP
jgi:hypothetical protein